MNQRIVYLLAGGLMLCACNEPEGNSEEDDNKLPKWKKSQALVKTPDEVNPTQETEVPETEVPVREVHL
jgi:hypothetical protein